MENGRYCEAAFFARTYLPSHISEIVKCWKAALLKAKHPASSLLADPNDFMDLFPQVMEASQYENIMNKVYSSTIPSTAYMDYKSMMEAEEGVNPMNLLALVKEEETKTEEDNGTSTYFSQNVIESTNIEQEEEEPVEEKIEVNINQIIEEEKERQKEKLLNSQKKEEEEQVVVPEEVEMSEINIEDEIEDLELDTELLEEDQNVDDLKEGDADDILDIQIDDNDDELDDLEKELANI